MTDFTPAEKAYADLGVKINNLKAANKKAADAVAAAETAQAAANKADEDLQAADKAADESFGKLTEVLAVYGVEPVAPADPEPEPAPEPNPTSDGGS